MLGCRHCGRSFTSSRALFAHLAVCEAQHIQNIADHPTFITQQLCDAVTNVTTHMTAIATSNNNDQTSRVHSPIAVQQETNCQSHLAPQPSPNPNITLNTPETHDTTLDIQAGLVNVDCNSEPDLVPSCEGTHILGH